MCQSLQMTILQTHKVYDPIESLLTAILLKISQINLEMIRIQKIEKLAFWSKLP